MLPKRTAENPWPCPKCGGRSHPDPKDPGYVRICDVCGNRQAFEAFSGRPE